jgi:hypothetical protein
VLFFAFRSTKHKRLSHSMFPKPRRVSNNFKIVCYLHALCLSDSSATAPKIVLLE